MTVVEIRNILETFKVFEWKCKTLINTNEHTETAKAFGRSNFKVLAYGKFLEAVRTTVNSSRIELPKIAENIWSLTLGQHWHAGELVPECIQQKHI